MTTPLTPPAHIRHTEQRTLEQERSDLQQRDRRLNAERKRFAHDLHGLYLRWQLLYPGASTREFLGWYGEGEVHNRLYSHLRAGLAIGRGLDADTLRLGDLEALGRRLLSGETPEQIRAGAAPPPDSTTIRVSQDTARALDQTFAELSDSDTRLTRQDALETAVQAFAHAPALIRRALVSAASTGENPLDALVKAVDERRDYRKWLASQGCAVPGCGVRPVELHHLRLPDLPDMPGLRRFRDKQNELLLPCCQRHHQTGREGAHQMSQAEWSQLHFGHPQMAFFLASRYMAEFIYQSEKDNEGVVQ